MIQAVKISIKRIKWHYVNKSDHGSQGVTREGLFEKWHLSESWRMKSSYPCEGSGKMVDQSHLVLWVFHWMWNLPYQPKLQCSTLLHTPYTVNLYISKGFYFSEICIQWTEYLHILLMLLLSGDAWAITSLISNCCFYYNYIFSSI